MGGLGSVCCRAAAQLSLGRLDARCALGRLCFQLCSVKWELVSSGVVGHRQRPATPRGAHAVVG